MATADISGAERVSKKKAEEAANVLDDAEDATDCKDDDNGDDDEGDDDEKKKKKALNVRASAKASSALRNALSAPDQRSSIRANARSATRQWIGEERALGSRRSQSPM